MEKEVTGQGRRMGMGAGGNCICPKCGYKVAHQPGKPCREMQCPTCGITMQREGGRCHQATNTDSFQENTRQVLGASGLRFTKQRALILEIIRQGQGHLDADEL